MVESIPDTTKPGSAHDTKYDVDALQKERCGTSQLPSEGNVLNTPMYSVGDWEILYELRSLDGRQQNICCLKAYALYCFNSIRLKISKPKKMDIGDPNLFVIPALPPDKLLSDDKAVSVTDVHVDIPNSARTDIFDSRTETIEKRRVFTFMSTVMNVPDATKMIDLQAKTNTANTEKQMNCDEIKAIGSNECVVSKDTKIRTSTSSERIQHKKERGRFLRMLRWLRRK